MMDSEEQIDWDKLAAQHHISDLPVLLVAGTPPRELPDDCPVLREEWEMTSLGTPIEHGIIKYEPDWWRIEENGDVVIGYPVDTEVVIQSEDYDRIRVVNPMTDELDEAVVMERSNLRMSIFDASSHEPTPRQIREAIEEAVTVDMEPLVDILGEDEARTMAISAAASGRSRLFEGIKDKMKETPEEDQTASATAK